MHLPITTEMIKTGENIMKPEEYYFKTVPPLSRHILSQGKTFFHNGKHPFGIQKKKERQ